VRAYISAYALAVTVAKMTLAIGATGGISQWSHSPCSQARTMLCAAACRCAPDGLGPKNKRTYTPGGKAMKYYASVRLAYQQVGTQREAIVDPLTHQQVSRVSSQEVRVRVMKNKVGPPFREAVVRVRFGEVGCQGGNERHVYRDTGCSHRRAERPLQSAERNRHRHAQERQGAPALRAPLPRARGSAGQGQHSLTTKEGEHGFSYKGTGFALSAKGRSSRACSQARRNSQGRQAGKSRSAPGG
jgi:RecA/RadA recombinase